MYVCLAKRRQEVGDSQRRCDILTYTDTQECLRLCLPGLAVEMADVGVFPANTRLG